MNLPNKLTVGRMIAVPFFVAAFMMQYYMIAFIIFIAASFTDLLDGKIARARGLVTNFGKIMDPLADKILVYSALCLLIGEGTIPAWSLIVILAREFAVSGMRTVAASEGRVVAAGMSGKIKTVLQMLAVPTLILALTLDSVYVLMTIGMALFWASFCALSMFASFAGVSEPASPAIASTGRMRMTADVRTSLRVCSDGLPGRPTMMFLPPWELISASATPEASRICPTSWG